MAVMRIEFMAFRPSVCDECWRVCHNGNQAGNRRSKNGMFFDVTWYQTYALPKETWALCPDTM